MACLAAAADAQSGNCEQFKATLAARIEATGVRGYSLEVVPGNSAVPSGAKAIGNCDGGVFKVLYRRWGGGSPAAAGEAKPAPALRPLASAPAAAAPPASPAAASKPVSPPPDPPKPAPMGAEELQRAVDRIVDQLARAEYRVELPASMTLGDSVRVRLAPGSDATVQLLQRALGGAAEGAAPATAERLEAQLAGANFGIRALTPKEQSVTSAGRTEWQWDVEPTQTGAQSLRLTLSAVFRIDGAPAQRELRSFEQAVTVSASLASRLSDFAGDRWHWLWALLLLPAGALAWSWYSRHSAYDEAGLPRGPKL